MTPAKNVEVQMEHALTSMGTRVDDDAVPGLDYPLQFRDLVTGQHQTPQQPGIRILQLGNRSHMFSGDDQRMGWRLGIDIVKRNHQFIFID